MYCSEYFTLYVEFMVIKLLGSKCVWFFTLLEAKGKCGKSALARNDSFPMALSPVNRRPGMRKETNL